MNEAPLVSIYAASLAQPEVGASPHHQNQVPCLYVPKRNQDHRRSLEPTHTAKAKHHNCH